MKFLYITLFTFAFSGALFADDQADYQAAIMHAALHKSESRVSSLTTIQGSTANMVTFTTYDGYTTKDTTLGANVWTTVASDTQQLCRQYVRENKRTLTPAQLNVWLAKLLGLPAENANKRRFVEFEVPVIQAYYGASKSNIGIFRPCTDPRIGAHHDASPICPKQMDPNDSNISSDYKTWFINNSITAYSLDHGAPWTEYGYTYNWNTQSNSTMGVSEFVVLKGTPVMVIPNPADATSAYISAEEYCS